MALPKFSLEGKVALITGGRRGIGRRVALAFAEAGADVAVCDLVMDDGQLGSVAEEIQGIGRRTLAVQPDTSQKRDIENMVERASRELGGIDILFSNAGTASPGPLLELPDDEWDRVINVNLKGYYLCAQAVGRKMVERKGTLSICQHSLRLKPLQSAWGLTPLPRLCCNAHPRSRARTGKIWYPRKRNCAWLDQDRFQSGHLEQSRTREADRGVAASRSNSRNQRSYRSGPISRL